MNSLLVLAAVIIGAALLIQSDVLPYQMMKKSEVTALKARIQQLEAGHQARVNSGAWMRDPEYRTSLEKNVLAGGEERPTPRWWKPGM
jgi:hypothetical protein